MTETSLETTQNKGTIAEYLKNNWKLIEEAAQGSAINPKKMMEITLHCMRNNEKLLACSRGSVLSAVLTATNLGLFPDPVLGEVFLVPFRNNKENCFEAQAIVGYRGLVKLLKDSGFVLDVQPREVFANDVFEYEYGLVPKLRHIPASGDRGSIKGYYVIIQLDNGITKFHYMTAEETKKHGERFTKSKTSKGEVFGVWKDHAEAMGMKTCLKQAVKYLPLTPRLTHTIKADEVRETGNTVDISPAGIPMIPDSFYDEPEQTTNTDTGEATQKPTGKATGLKGLEDNLFTQELEADTSKIGSPAQEPPCQNKTELPGIPTSVMTRGDICLAAEAANPNNSKGARDYIARIAAEAADEINVQLPVSKLAKIHDAEQLLEAIDDKTIARMLHNINEIDLANEATS